MNVMHFKSQKERLDYLKGKYTEITPQEVSEIIPQEVSEEKPKKRAKKGKKKDDTVQAE